MRRFGLVLILGWLCGCGPKVVLVGDDDGTTSDAPDDDDDSTTSSTTTSPSGTVLPSTSVNPSTSLPMTTPATVTAGPMEGCVDLELIGGPVGSGLTAGSTIGTDDDFQFCEAGGSGTSGGNFSGGDYTVSWTAATTGQYHFTLAGSDYDTVLGVFPAVCGGDPHVCNDDCVDVSSSVDYYAYAGEEVYIVIDGFQGQEGNFVLNIAAGNNPSCYGGSGYDEGSAGFISSTG